MNHRNDVQEVIENMNNQRQRERQRTDKSSRVHQKLNRSIIFISTGKLNFPSEGSFLSLSLFFSLSLSLYGRNTDTGTHTESLAGFNGLSQFEDLLPRSLPLAFQLSKSHMCSHRVSGPYRFPWLFFSQAQKSSDWMKTEKREEEEEEEEEKGERQRERERQRTCGLCHVNSPPPPLADT